MAMTMDRRAALRVATRAAVCATAAAPALAFAAADAQALPSFFAELEERTFRFFWDCADPDTGLMPDRWPTPSFCSIAAVGFALTAWPLGAERGWVSRGEVRERTLRTLRFLAQLPMGEAAHGVAGHKGFFYHFLDMKTGLRFANCELSSVDTALFHMGALFAAGWFDADHPDEAEIRTLAQGLVDRAEWPWFQSHGTLISMGWHPESGFIERGWDGYNEGKMVYVLALGSGSHPVPDTSWRESWCATYPRFWRGEGAQRRLAFAPLFGHQYSECWIDFRGIYDAPMRAAGFDYFENSRRAVLANRQWCMANPMRWQGYSSTLWGLTACDGPGGFPAQGGKYRYAGYSARGPGDEPDGFDDGTIAPTAAIASLPFAPEVCIPATLALRARNDPRLYGRYGFRDAFNPGFRDTAVGMDSGTVDAELGWVANDMLGIDQGPIVAMLANYRTEAVWRVMRKSATIRRGLVRAGFTGGWLG